MLAHNRLVTLLGPGGSGKTRLAQEAAHRTLEDYCDGVFFVELAGLPTADLLPDAVAHAVGIQPGGIDQIIGQLRSRHMFLVLDNCEHLVAGCVRFVTELLAQCPRVRVLTTSREVLGVPGEAVFGTPPLSVPPAGALAIADLLQYEAVQLFTERATAAMPGFRITEQNAGAVAQICIRLDGVPLALELAAARIRLLSPQQIAARLDDRFRLLTTGPRGADERHRTLRATVEWGHDLLSPGEQICFRRLAVFIGGLTLEAAEAVCAGGEITRDDIPDLISQLLDKSFLHSSGDDGPLRRYHLLETLRMFGLEALERSGELEAVRRLHRDWCRELTSEAWNHMRGKDQAVWLDRLASELDNLRAAMRWSLEAGEAQDCLQIAYWLDWFWCSRGHFREGREWLVEALSRCPEPTELRGRALNAAGSVTSAAGDYRAAEAFYVEAVAIGRQFGKALDLGAYLNNLGMVIRRQGDNKRANQLTEEALALWLQAGEKGRAATALQNLGVTALNDGEYDQARRYLREALQIQRELKDLRREYITTGCLAVNAYQQGNWDEAWECVNRVEALWHELHYDSVYAISLCTKGMLYMKHHKDLVKAEAALRESFRMQREVGDRAGLVDPLITLAELFVARGRPHKAARLLGAVEAICEETGYALPKIDKPWHDRVVKSVRTALGHDAMQAAWAVGRTRLREDLPEIEGNESAATATAFATPAVGTGPGPEALTAREIEIARMVAAGCTIKETSQRLFLSPRTVQKHEENIRAKLGLVNRASVAAWAVRHGLTGE